MKKATNNILILLLVIILSGCKVSYSFRGTNLSSEVKSISISTIENRAMKVNPSLSNNLTNELQDKYRKLTKLEMLQEGGDLEISGYIASYDISPTAVTAEEVASMNRLTVTVKIFFTNNITPEESFEEGKSFVAFQDYDSNLSIDAVEAQLCDEIIKTLVEDIFNATVANW
jgi:hypothetical protein